MTLVSRRTTASEPIYKSVLHTPVPPLRPYLGKCIGYRMKGFAPGIHAGLPSSWLTLVITLDAPLDLAVMPDPHQSPGLFDAMVGGLHASPATIRHDGGQFGIQLEVNPLGARALFGRPAADLASSVVGLEELLVRGTAELIDRLRTASTWAQRFAVLDHALMRHIVEVAGPRPDVAFAWDRLRGSGGTVRVGQLAQELGWSRRHLTTLFRSEYGVAPKTLTRVFRFERSRGLLTAPHQARSLAAVAALCGYADQAHMSRDWRDLAGSSPTAWMAREQLPFVQAGTDTAGAH